MWTLYVWPLYGSTLCEHSMWALYVRPLYGMLTQHHKNTRNTTTKTPKTPPQSCKTATSTSSRAGCWHSEKKVRVLGPQHHNKNTTTPTQKHHHTTTRTPPQKHHHKNTSMCEQHVCARCLDTLYVNTLCEHEHRKVRKLPRKMNISSWAGCGRTPKSTRITMQTRLQFLGWMLQRQKRQKSPSFIVKHRSRALENTEKYENYHEKWTSKKLKRHKTTKIYRRNPF